MAAQVGGGEEEEGDGAEAGLPAAIDQVVEAAGAVAAEGGGGDAGQGAPGGRQEGEAVGRLAEGGEAPGAAGLADEGVGGGPAPGGGLVFVAEEAVAALVADEPGSGFEGGAAEPRLVHGGRREQAVSGEEEQRGAGSVAGRGAWPGRLADAEPQHGRRGRQAGAGRPELLEEGFDPWGDAVVVTQRVAGPADDGAPVVVQDQSVQAELDGGDEAAETRRLKRLDGLDGLDEEGEVVAVAVVGREGGSGGGSLDGPQRIRVPGLAGGETGAGAPDRDAAAAGPVRRIGARLVRWAVVGGRRVEAAAGALPCERPSAAIACGPCRSRSVVREGAGVDDGPIAAARPGAT